MQLWQVQTSGIKLFPQKNAIINCGMSILQKLNFSPKKMQLWQVQTSGIEFFPQKMQLSIVARPYFTNWTFPPKKCNCGKSGLQELNFSPKNAIVASLGLTILEKLTFPPKKCKCPDFRNWTCPPQKWKTISCGTSRLQNLNFPQKKVKSVIMRNWTFAPPKCGKKQKCVGESPDFKHWGFSPKQSKWWESPVPSPWKPRLNSNHWYIHWWNFYTKQQPFEVLEYGPQKWNFHKTIVTCIVGNPRIIRIQKWAECSSESWRFL